MSEPAAGGVVLRARDLALGYGAEPVLAGVDWKVRTGELWFLIGPNGSGKTTLLRAVLGLLEPTRGALERDAALAGRERIGFVPQRSELNPALPTTVRELVTLGLVGTRAPAADREERLAWALTHAGLGGLAERSIWALSGGQRQRALVARALVRRPSLLILDEPTEGLDVPTEESFLQTVVHLNRDHDTTILFVTHKLEIAVRYASHLAFFHEGRVQAGERDAVLALPDLERAFGRRPVAS